MTTVSRETQEKLERYQALLLKWQKAINLVSRNTVDEAWHRHFEDSMQLQDIVPPGAKTVVDLGSGAGFPGLVLAILNRGQSFHLIESDQKKCEFLRTVARETGTDISVHDTRIEEIGVEISADVITARALASLSDLFDYCLPWAEKNPALNMVFLKGQKAEQEIEEAKNRFSFDCESFPSATDPGATILRIRNLAAL